jgi:hypothetical protein
MNGVTVPNNFKHLMQKPKQKTEDYKDLIRRLIVRQDGNVLAYSDFEKELGVSTASIHVKRLMKAGYVTRTRLRHAGKGWNYTYQWHSTPISNKAAALANGEVVTRSLNLPDFPIAKDDLVRLPELIVQWFDEKEPSAEQLAGVMLFRRSLDDKYKEVEAARKKKVEGVSDAEA